MLEARCHHCPPPPVVASLGQMLDRPAVSAQVEDQDRVEGQDEGPHEVFGDHVVNISNGMVALSAEAGLGIAPDPAFIEKSRTT
jgi:L-alanine-DL-glutamate epimerase-like enolase superfamily enzyme